MFLMLHVKPLRISRQPSAFFTHISKKYKQHDIHKGVWDQTYIQPSKCYSNQLDPLSNTREGDKRFQL